MYAQNDALFEENDWENLERLMQSNKKDDPLKVGRFGIGFNSVYHMTGKSIYGTECDTGSQGMDLVGHGNEYIFQKYKIHFTSLMRKTLQLVLYMKVQS